MFSSPLAECYARDEISGRKTTIGSGYKSEGNVGGQVEDGQKTALFDPLLRTKFEQKFDSRTLHPDNKKRGSEPRYRELSAQKFFSASLKREASRPLLSPISFTPPTDVSEASDSTGSCFDDERTDMRRQSNIHSPAAASLVVQDSNRCPFPISDPEIFKTEDIVSTKKAAVERLHAMSVTNKPRAMSLGEGLRSTSPDISQFYQEPPGSQHQKSLHRTTGSRELRRSAGSHQAGRDCTPWVDQIIRATECAGSYQVNHDTNSYGPPRRHGRPRLWLDASKNEERIEEAHITTVTQSPTKPKVITIARRGSSVSPTKEASSCLNGNGRGAESKPATPPETPQSAVGLGISSRASPGIQSRTKDFGHSTHDQLPTPPNSCLATPRMRSTVRRAPNFPCKTPRLESAMQTVLSTALPKDKVASVMAELEAAIYNHPTARLYLDSPIIEHIRLQSRADTVHRVPSERPCTPRVTAPHSRYSLFKPLSSHPVKSPRDVPCYRGVEYQSKEYLKDSQMTVPVPNTNATTAALRVIFPHAPGALLDSLQATYLALNYLVSVPCPSQMSSNNSAHQSSPAPSTVTLLSIPRKALATLGIQAPSPAASTSWLRSETPDAEAKGTRYGDNNPQMQKERMENLQVSLRICVRGLLGEIEGRRLGKRDESLVRAVGEVVRCGESVSSV